MTLIDSPAPRCARSSARRAPRQQRARRGARIGGASSTGCAPTTGSPAAPARGPGLLGCLQAGRGRALRFFGRNCMWTGPDGRPRRTAAACPELVCACHHPTRVRRRREAIDLPPERDQEQIDALTTMVRMILVGARACTRPDAVRTSGIRNANPTGTWGGQRRSPVTGLEAERRGEQLQRARLVVRVQVAQFGIQAVMRIARPGPPGVRAAGVLAPVTGCRR